ncbi:MAG: MoaD/ThiS family protein [Salibacteraceae bacterium]
MQLQLIAYGIARDIFGHSQLAFSLKKGQSVAELKQALIEQYPEFDRLASLRFAVGEEYRSNDYTLSENDEVVIIPPVSGG